MALTFDIFCRVVDNYGDIGVCWRLARQLAQHADISAVRLWVDDLRSFQRIASEVCVDQPEQCVGGVTVIHWHGFEPRTPANVVIEAFACSPPAEYLARMTSRQLWVNLEYLSAEAWVESCHGLPSTQGNGLRKFFFFPGFTEKAGGLLREPGLIENGRPRQADSRKRLDLLARLGVEDSWLKKLEGGALLAYVYCYPQAPLQALINALACHDRDALVLMPVGIWPGKLPAVSPVSHHGATGPEVATHPLPFVDQGDFDRLLWSSELNIVRGEDSLVRAIWAGRPFIWQPYLQDDNAHLDKLRAWLEVADLPEHIAAMMLAWNQGAAHEAEQQLTKTLRSHQGFWLSWEHAAEQLCDRLATQTDLAARLVDFCTVRI